MQEAFANSRQTNSHTQVEPAEPTNTSQTSTDAATLPVTGSGPVVAATGLAAGPTAGPAAAHANANGNTAPQVLPRTMRLTPGMDPYWGLQIITPDVTALRDAIIRHNQMNKKKGELRTTPAPPAYYRKIDFDVTGRLAATSELMKYYMDLRLFTKEQWDAMCVEWIRTPDKRSQASLSKVKELVIEYEVRGESSSNNPQQPALPQPSLPQPAPQRPIPPFPVINRGWGNTIPREDWEIPPESPKAISTIRSRKAEQRAELARLHAGRPLPPGASRAETRDPSNEDSLGYQSTTETNRGLDLANEQDEEEGSEGGVDKGEKDEDEDEDAQCE